MDMSLSQLQEMVNYKEPGVLQILGVTVRDDWATEQKQQQRTAIEEK